MAVTRSKLGVSGDSPGSAARDVYMTDDFRDATNRHFSASQGPAACSRRRSGEAIRMDR